MKDDNEFAAQLARYLHNHVEVFIPRYYAAHGVFIEEEELEQLIKEFINKPS